MHVSQNRFMTTSDQDLAARQITVAAEQHGWPLIADPHLRFVTPQLKTVLAVWQEQRRSRTMPARSDLTLPDLKVALPNLAFLDIQREDDRTRYKVRLIGGALDHFLGSPATGRFVDEAVPQPFAEKWSALWQASVDFRAPMRTVVRVEFPNRRYYMCEALNAPLAEDGENPNILMIASYFHGREDGAARANIATQLMNELGEQAMPALT